MSSALTSEYRALARLGLPVLVTQVGIIAVSFADTMMVGAYGTLELGAASFVNNIFLVAIVALLGFANGMTPVTGALYGNGLLREAGTSLRAGFVLNFGISLVFTMIMGAGYFLLPSFGQPEELMPLIRPYYLIILSSIPATAVFNCCLNTSNGLTDTAMPMWIMIGGNLLNVAGNYILIFGKFGFPELGLIGAGLSTASSRYLMAVAIMIGFRFRYRYRTLREGLRLKPGRTMTLKVWKTSYPIMIQNGIECFLWALGAVVCGWFGTAQLASYQIANIVGQFGFMIYLSAGVAVSIRVANFTGVGDVGSIRLSSKAGLHLMLFMATAASAIFLFEGRHLFSLFSPDSSVIEAGLPLVVPLVLYQYFDAVQLNYGSALRGTGDVKPLITVAAVSYILVGCSSLFLFATGLDMGNVGVYYSFSVTLLCAAVMLNHYFRRAVKAIENSDFKTI